MTVERTSSRFEPVPLGYLGVFVAGTLLVSWGLSLLTITESVPDGTITAIMVTPAIITLALRRVQGYSVVGAIVSSLRGSTVSSFVFGSLYPVSFIGIAAIVALSTGLGTYQPGVENVVQQGPLYLLPLFFLVQGAITYGEELGWRGFLLPGLAEKWGRLAATTVVGVVWALYHAPVLYFGAAVTGLGDPVFVTVIQAGTAFTASFAFSYCYFLSEGSVVPVLLLHVLWNTLNPWVLGNVYTNVEGFVAGRVILVSGEGVVGLVLGLVAMGAFAVLIRRGTFIEDTEASPL